MRPRGSGHIVNIGSMSADQREPSNDVYVSTKAGIQGFTESLRKNVNKDNIRVSLIESGAVNTSIQENPEAQNREKVEKMENARTGRHRAMRALRPDATRPLRRRERADPAGEAAHLGTARVRV